MEYAVGPILALLVGMKFSVWKNNELEKRLVTLQERVVAMDKEFNNQQNEIPKKVTGAMQPLAKAIVRLNEEVGIQ